MGAIVDFRDNFEAAGCGCVVLVFETFAEVLRTGSRGGASHASEVGPEALLPFRLSRRARTRPFTVPDALVDRSKSDSSCPDISLSVAFALLAPRLRLTLDLR